MKIATRSATAASDRSPPESSDSRSIFLPTGRTDTSMPVVSGSSGFVSEMLPVPPGEQHGEHLCERRPRVFERGQEDRLHPLVELVDDRQQVLARLREVGELLDQELVPLLQCGELLQRQRIHATELGELALGILQSAALLRPDRRTDAAPGRFARLVDRPETA